MTGMTASLANANLRRARSHAWLTLGIVSLPLVPVPAVMVAIASKTVRIGFDHFPDVFRFILSVTPAFALPAFALGCFIGVVVHMQVNSAERVGAYEAHQLALVGKRPAVASGLLVGVLFAATGLVIAAALLGAA